MRVLIGCETSGVVREAFRSKGFDAWSCDILPAEDGSEHHIQQDVLEVLQQGWKLAIVHPPCTYLCSSGLHWNSRRPGRAEKTEEALEFVRKIMQCSSVEHLAIENPTGCIGTRIRKSDQIIQPYQFGDDASKGTRLWLRALPKLKPTKYVPPRIVNGKNRWANQTDSGQNREPPSEDRWKIRSRTYKGIAEAMADQWGRFITGQTEEGHLF